MQTDADRERVLDGLGDASGQDGGFTKSELANTVKRLAPRWFLMREAHAREGLVLVKPRWAISLMLGPMTRTEIRKARGQQEGVSEREGDAVQTRSDEAQPPSETEQKAG